MNDVIKNNSIELPAQLNHPKLQELIASASALNRDQLLWCSGYLAAIAAGSAAQAAPASSADPVVILYASQTGNGVGIGKKLQQQLAQAGVVAEIFNALDYRKAQLKKAAVVLLVASTHGEGDVPDTAMEFAEYLNSDKAKNLKTLSYSVLALGDSSYAHYCQVGRDFDARLAELGATELAPRQDCDLDYDADSKSWIETVVDAVKQQVGSSEPAADGPISYAAQAAGNDYSRTEPWLAQVLANQLITGRGSSKQTRHLELSLEDSGMAYLPGDSIGILAPNPLELVEAIVAHQQLDPQARVENPQGQSVALVDALVNDFEIAPLSRPVLQRFGELSDSLQIAGLLASDQADQLSEWLYGRDLLDLLVEQPVPSLTAEQLVSLLRPQQPRLYSIASSLAASSDEVHLTLATVEYSARARDRQGVTTGWIAETVKEGDQVAIYRHENPLFRLPEEPDRPIIMIGPGTGVAPFRAFLDQREAESAEGKNWLFFGDRNFTTDFLYQREWQAHLASGLLTKIDLAFSRDQSERIYVQQRMLEQSQEFYRWLEEGAAVYVCGDAGRMASDVHDALLNIIQKEGGLSAESAADYVSLMQRERRYQRDVY